VRERRSSVGLPQLRFGHWQPDAQQSGKLVHGAQSKSVERSASACVRRTCFLRCSGPLLPQVPLTSLLPLPLGNQWTTNGLEQRDSGPSTAVGTVCPLVGSAVISACPARFSVTPAVVSMAPHFSCPGERLLNGVREGAQVQNPDLLCERSVQVQRAMRAATCRTPSAPRRSDRPRRGTAPP
jgi:hypothetical protein